MIEARVWCDEPETGWGTYRFEVLPSAGDRIVVGNNRGSCDILVVNYVEHHPVQVPTSPNARPDPYVMVNATFHDSFGD